MGDRPIIFSAPMMRALLDRRKTQTRRVLSGDRLDRVLKARQLPYAPGDRLYVREAWRIKYNLDDIPPCNLLPSNQRPIWFEADKAGPEHGKRVDWGRLRSGIYMPRWASRLTLTVTEVRVQRLQEISEEDAMAEGVKPYVSTCADDNTPAADAFMDLWNSLHGPDAWDANPWVVAVRFTVQHKNIDQIGGANA